MTAAKAAQHVDRADKRPRAARDRLNALKARAAPPPAIEPDAALIDLAGECQREFTAVTQQWARQDLPDDALDHATELYERLTETPATTLIGVTAKARALLTWAPNDMNMAGGSTVLARRTAEELVALAESAKVPQRQRPSIAPPPHSESVEAQLLRYISEFEAWNAFQDEAQVACDAARRAGNEEAKERADIAVATAVRCRHRAPRLASLLQPSTPREFGLLARLVADEMAEWWDDSHGGPDPGEFACRGLLDSLMNAAGIVRAPIVDSTIEATRRDYLTPGAELGGR
ncbi:hypothetical protein [Methylobacterium iners]|uniref:DUF222 domain-containing protein n=1 Tax=Methylobacterium iners TaxID=418707 RepID=A0ABQ4RX90_9HYPH|nr:hypothetical protein [Methylobacterium iners]GJD94140.1 hypothetical protein OCOJLMKI_1342 [Methylobacterium iners]